MPLLGARPGDRILDAGCGTGRFATRLARGGAEVVGIDFSVRSLARCPPRIRTAAADLRHLPFVDDAFDRVLCSEVIEHLLDRRDLRKGIREMGRVTRPGGTVVLTVFNFNLAHRLRGDRECADFRHTHYRRYTATEFRRAVEEGLGEGWRVLPPVPLLVLSTLDRIGRAGLGTFPTEILWDRWGPSLRRIDRRLSTVPAARHLAHLLAIRAERVSTTRSPGAHPVRSRS